MKEKNAEISARIAEVIEKMGENPSSFAKCLGYSRAQTIYDILSGKSAPSYDFFSRFSNAEISASINLRWLLTGVGDMHLSNDAFTNANVNIADDTALQPIITQLLDNIKEQAAEIGRLKERIRQLTAGREKRESDADTPCTADVG